MSVHRRMALLQFGVGAFCSWLVGTRSADAETTQYQYDALGRLRQVIFDNGNTVIYTYDAAGNRTQVSRPSSAPTPPTPPPVFSQTIQITGTAPVDLRALADTAGYPGNQNVNVTFQLGSGVTITGTAGSPNGGIAIDTGDWPQSTYTIAIALQVSGKIRGGGGKGGNGNGVAGGLGGDAIYCRVPVAITVNSGGEVRSGGGGGGGGGRGRENQGGEWVLYGGGGAGGGAPNGALGTGGGGDGGTGANGTAGSTTAGGAGGAGAGVAGAGGAGGGYGANGVAGDNAYQAGGALGLAGFAVRKNGNYVSVTNNGTISGTVG